MGSTRASARSCIITTAGLTGVLRLAWDDGVWIATTLYAPYVLTSSDLETWTAVPVPVPDDTAANRSLKDCVRSR